MADNKTQFKINKLAKDLGLKSKDLCDMLAKRGKEVAVQKSLEPAEFDILFDSLTGEHQISDIGDYLEGKSYIPSKKKPAKKKEETKPKAEPAEAPKTEGKAEPKPEKKAVAEAKPAAPEAKKPGGGKSPRGNQGYQGEQSAGGCKGFRSAQGIRPKSAGGGKSTRRTESDNSPLPRACQGGRRAEGYARSRAETDRGGKTRFSGAVARRTTSRGFRGQHGIPSAERYPDAETDSDSRRRLRCKPPRRRRTDRRTVLFFRTLRHKTVRSERRLSAPSADRKLWRTAGSHGRLRCERQR